MPHVVVLYTANLEDPPAPGGADLPAFCRRVADALVGLCDDTGRPVFPTGGVRVFAYPATHFAVADGSGDHGFVYVQMRMARGRSAAVHQAAGDALATAARTHFAALLAQRRLGLTVQVDEGAEVFDAKLGNLHALFDAA